MFFPNNKIQITEEKHTHEKQPKSVTQNKKQKKKTLRNKVKNVHFFALIF